MGAIILQIGEVVDGCFRYSERGVLQDPGAGVRRGS